MLKQFNVIFDYPHHQILLYKNHVNFVGHNIRKWKKIPIYYISDNIFTKGFVGNLPARIIFDTGNNSLTMTPEIADKIESKNKNMHYNCGDYKIVSDLKMINYSLKSQIFQVHNTHPEADISLGWDFFKNNIIYFNFKEKYMAIK